jgi:GcrA cell cycle regulator
MDSQIGSATAAVGLGRTEDRMSWTQERVELLRKLWLDGLSAAQVAAELGAGVTRNAVIGKIHRLGLAERGKAATAPRPRAPRAPRTPAAESAARGPMIMGNLALAAAPRIAPAPVALPEEEVVVQLSHRVTIMELRESMCRWPVGDPTTPEFRFCGGNADVGAPYCRHHSGIAYQPQIERRRANGRVLR